VRPTRYKITVAFLVPPRSKTLGFRKIGPTRSKTDTLRKSDRLDPKPLRKPPCSPTLNPVSWTLKPPNLAQVGSLSRRLQLAESEIERRVQELSEMTEVRLYSASLGFRVLALGEAIFCGLSRAPLPCFCQFCLFAHAQIQRPESVVDCQHARASKRGANQYKKQVMDMEQKVKKVTIEHRDMGNIVVAAKTEAKKVGLVTSLFDFVA
jgi:hypothetical protein